MANSRLKNETRNMVSGREWRWVSAVTLIVLALTSLPYLFGYLSSPPDKQFMGLMLDIPDHGGYLSWWRGFQSAPLVSNKLTPEPNDPLFFNLLWWVLAQVSVVTGLGYAPVYQAFRWLAGASFLWAVYRLIAQFLPKVRERRLAFLLITFSSGLGWALVILKYTLAKGELLYPLDIYVAEGNSFLCILGYPHFVLAGTFITLTFEYFWRGWKEARTRYMLIAGVLALLLGWQHAYDLLLIYSVTALFALLMWWKQRAFPWRLFWGGMIIFALSCSGAVYSVILTTVDPLWEEVLSQFANAGVYTPSPPHLIILFGFPLIFAAATCAGLAWRKRWSDENLFIMGWFLAGAILNYIPTDFQIHMLNSWQIPMMVLVTKGLSDFVAPAISKRRLATRQNTIRWLTVILLLVVLPTNLYLLAWRFVDLARHDYPYYLYRDDVAALDWLRQNASPDDVVLSSLTVGQYLPAISGSKAFLAHWAQTVSFFDKRDRVARFFDAATSAEERVETLQTFGADYVFHGPAERNLGDYNPAATPWLTRAFSSSQVNVYSVRFDRLPAGVRSGGEP
jgi:hypothetical protein